MITVLKPSYLSLLDVTRTRITLWGSTGINKRGEFWLDYIVSYNFDVLIVGSEPTFVNSTRAEVIDVTLVSSDARDLVTGWKVLDEASFSDHRYIVFEFRDVEQPTVFYRNHKKSNWDYFEDSYTPVGVLDSFDSIDKAVHNV